MKAKAYVLNIKVGGAHPAMLSPHQVKYKPKSSRRVKLVYTARQSPVPLLEGGSPLGAASYSAKHGQDKKRVEECEIDG